MANSKEAFRKGEQRAATLFISPFFLLFAVFGLLPIVFTFIVSFYNWDLLGEPIWAGIDNYTNLLQDPQFFNSLFNTISIFLLSSIPQLATALILAVVLNARNLKLRIFWRSIILFPFITSTVAVALVFGAMFADNGGMMNWALGLLGLGPVPWHVDTLPSHLAIAAMVNWRWTGYNTLIFLAALQSVPKELYEAAEIDGASKFSQFVNITIPQIRPTLFFTLITSTIGGLQIFAEPFQFGYASYSGGSDSQFSTLSLYMFDQAFTQMKLGYSSAVAMGLFLLIAVIAAINYFVSSRLVKADK
jgi:cellobiose transport system permease protein